jgi:16S rRNA (cytosine1402-N4)-methyltransferase
MNFAELKDSDDGGGILHTGFSHVLFDLGIGSHQLADESRGFSFTATENLSMRYGAGELPPANITSLNVLADRLGHLPDVTEIIAGLREDELAEVIYVYGEERYSRRIAAAIKAQPLATTSQALAASIVAALPSSYERGRIHPATRTFQALRLAVNRELEALSAALPVAVKLLAPQGKIAVISFHSLEDRIVKYFFRDQAKDCVCPPEQPECTCAAKASLKILTKHPVRAGNDEITKNPRARSAKLRVAEKLES